MKDSRLTLIELLMLLLSLDVFIFYFAAFDGVLCEPERTEWSHQHSTNRDVVETLPGNSSFKCITMVLPSCAFFSLILIL